MRLDGGWSAWSLAELGLTVSRYFGFVFKGVCPRLDIWGRLSFVCVSSSTLSFKRGA